MRLVHPLLGCVMERAKVRAHEAIPLKICPGCRRKLKKAGGSAIYQPNENDTRLVLYVVCPRCALRIRNSERAAQQIMECVEAFFDEYLERGS